MNSDLVSHLPDADMKAAPAALLRGGRRARELARQTGTAVVVMREGRLVEEVPAAATTPDAAALWVATWSGCLVGREQPGQDDERLQHLLNKHLR